MQRGRPENCFSGVVLRGLPGLPGLRPFVSATAFHWVDPEVGLAKAARMLRPSGWLALLTTGERYYEPLRSAVRQLWATYNPGQANWAAGAPWAEPLRETDLFGAIVERAHEEPLELPARTVLGVECTRATYLSFNDVARQGFAADLEALLLPAPSVTLVQETCLAMAPVSAKGLQFPSA